MEIRINKLLLDNAIERVSKAVSPTPFLPAQKGILIEAEDNIITFIGTNGELSIKHVIEISQDAVIEMPGKALIDLNILRNIVKKLDGDLSIQTDNKTMTISTAYDRFVINLYNLYDYPETEFTVYGDTLEINWNEFKQMIRNVIFASTSNDTNTVLSCVNISSTNNVLKLIATDRYRFAQELKNIENTNDFNISINAKNLKDLSGFEYDGIVKFYISRHKFAFEIDNTLIQSTVLDQPYQDVSKVIPTSYAYTLTISKRELNNLLNKASVIVAENYNKIKLYIKDNLLTISSTKEEIANAEITTSNFHYTDVELKLALNSKFLKEAISVFDDELTLNITKDKLRIVVLSNSNPNSLQLFTSQKGF